MTTEEFAQQAKRECDSGTTTAHHGGGEGRPFWNGYSFQFMYVPAFQFQPIPGIDRYRYVALDANGVSHAFESPTATALLEPIWKDIPEGVVELQVHALDEAGDDGHQVGARTFYKLAPFPADLPPAARSYRETVERIYDYAFQQSYIQHWLTHGTPDPDYDLNVYPSKMIPAIVTAMVGYARNYPERAEDALRIARNAADYLIGITPSAGEPMAYVPPTYQLDFRDHPETRENLKAAVYFDRVMMIYPAHAGSAYLLLEKATGERKYLDAALRIGAYYRDHVEENGSWYLLRSRTTGEPVSSNYCAPLERIIPFLMSLHERTGDGIWKELADGALEYVEKDVLASYDWEAQFEDSRTSANYSNLSHYGADALIRHYCRYHPDSPEHMEAADDLMRFVEDQFVIWKKPSPWNRKGFDTSLWMTPCGMEQYNWHVPIDASTADICLAFLAMHKAGRGDLHLEKAKALADSITRAQQPNGMMPTHWMTPEHLQGKDFWINCMFSTAEALTELADYLEANGIDG